MIEKFLIREASYCDLELLLSARGVAAASAAKEKERRGLKAVLIPCPKASVVATTADKQRICRYKCIAGKLNAGEIRCLKCSSPLFYSRCYHNRRNSRLADVVFDCSLNVFITRVLHINTSTIHTLHAHTTHYTPGTLHTHTTQSFHFFVALS